MFLIKFLFRMKIVHRFEKFHQNANDLFRMIFDSEINFFVTIIADENDLLTKITIELSNDRYFVKIMATLKQQIEKNMNSNDEFKTDYQKYRMNVNIELLYMKNKIHSNRLCISEKFQKQFLRYAHDEHAHEGVHRTYELLIRSVFIFRIKKLITQYVKTCSICQLFKSSKQLFYEHLQSISMFSELLCELNLNFVITLFVTTNDNNVFFTIIDRFFKYIKLVFEKKIMSAFE